jgi:predicted AAA+ superfamily ATPase
MQRTFESVIQHHIDHYEQMVFLTGPRQVGKTTLVKSLRKKNHTVYLNWDNLDDKQTILSGYQDITAPLHLEKLSAIKPMLILDEIHKKPDWKNFLKGFYDTFHGKTHIIVTGSAKLDIYQKGGDSLMGRYLLYHQFPLSVGECLGRTYQQQDISSPKQFDQKRWSTLLKYGGFPEPFLKQDSYFLNQWQLLKHHQLFREDLRDLSRIREVAQCELLANILRKQATSLINRSQLAKHICVSDSAIREWLDTLRSLYYCFFIQPWSKNVSRSLLKEPKCYLWDWSLINDPGTRIENFVACHLYKSIKFWTDIGLGQYELFFVRDKDKHEVDFLIVKNEAPWVLIEAKQSSNASMNPALYRFQKMLNVKHVLQLAYDMPYIDQDCFALEQPMIVPMITFLSQLV